MLNMRVTIVKQDETVTKDGVSHIEIDMSDLPNNVHAIQWYDTVGDVEYIDETQSEIVHIRNEEITDFSPYQKYVDACNDENRA
tara:strand:+ start:1639 stop:1890 length:252 start_codon:yes stop_codon:yes gene_type:complete